MYRIKTLLLLAMAVANPAAHAQDMIQIPAGPFTMGSNDGRDDERPAHMVTLAAFEIDRLQVTNAEFATFLYALRSKSGAAIKQANAKIEQSNEEAAGSC